MKNELYKKIEKSDGSIAFEPVDMDSVKICGRSIEEIRQILDGLEVEKIVDMDLTMNNVSKIVDMVLKEQDRIRRIELERMFGGEEF